jgi:hypothetical protein
MCLCDSIVGHNMGFWMQNILACGESKKCQ